MTLRVYHSNGSFTFQCEEFVTKINGDLEWTHTVRDRLLFLDKNQIIAIIREK